MFNKRVLILLFLLIIGIGAISSVGAADLTDDIAINSDFDKMEVDGRDKIIEDADASDQLSDVNAELDDSVDDEKNLLSSSDDDETLQDDNTNGRPISQLQELIENDQTGTINLRFDYYSTADDSMIGVVIDKPITINGNGHTIDANKHTRMFCIQSDGVVINDLTFKNAYYYAPNNYFLGHGGAVSIENGTTTFNNCKFYDNCAEQNGGAICSWDGLIVNNCEFKRNIAAGAKKPGTDTNTYYGYGGAIYVASPEGHPMNIYITNTIFESNSAHAAGALYIDFTGKDFNNHDMNPDLKCYLKNCQFLENTALWGGGAIYTYRDLYITDSTFSGNSGRSGGAICLENGFGIIDNYHHDMAVNLEINGKCTFYNNRAEYTGGAIQHSFNGHQGESALNDFIGFVRIYGDVLFESNHAKNGGALYIPDIEESSVKEVRFISNTADENGGAMYGGTAVDCIFSGNSDPQTYNVNFITSSKLTISQSGSNCNDKAITATLKKKNGSPITNQYVVFNINGKTSKIRTDSKGQATLKVSLPAKTYPVTVSYEGNAKCIGDTAKVSVAIKKANPKMNAPKTKFKVKTKTKKYTITLKNSLGSAIKNAKVTINVKGKTFKATTNAYGKATFKITNLKKKGGFNAKVKYSGDSYYNTVTKTVKITVK